MPLAICDRCGFEYHLSELRREWTGLMVCDADYDAKPAELRRPNLRPEGLPLRNARPEPEPIFVVVPPWGLPGPEVPIGFLALVDTDGFYLTDGDLYVVEAIID